MSALLNKITKEYVLVHTKRFSSPIRGYLTGVDEEYILIEEEIAKQGELFSGDKPSKPFFLIPINTIEAIAGIDPEQLKKIEKEEEAADDEHNEVKSKTKDSMATYDRSTKEVHKEGIPPPPSYMHSNPFVRDSREPEINSSGIKEIEFDEADQMPGFYEDDEKLEALKEQVRREVLEEFKKRREDI